MGLSAIGLCFTPIVIGLLGLIVGLVMKKINKFRSLQDILKAVGINSLIVISYYVLDYFTFRYVDTAIMILIASIVSSILLIIMMLIFAKVVRPETKS